MDPIDELERMIDSGKLAAAPHHEILPGVLALAGGLLFLTTTSTLIAADIHFGYEEVIGGALPLWSVDRSVEHLCAALEKTRAAELVLLGDIVHGPVLSDGAARTIFTALERLRSQTRLLLIAGNHEGRSRGRSLLGETSEELDRDGWRLLHGDVADLRGRAVIGHLHPSLHLGGNRTAPAFLSAPSLIVVPALTPYSPGLNIFSRDAQRALRPWLARDEKLTVTGVAGTYVYPFGELETLREMLLPKSRIGSARRRSRRLRPDAPNTQG